MKKFVCLAVSLFLLVLVKGQQIITYNGPTTFCQGAQVTLTASNAPGGSNFIWKKNGVVVPGQTTLNLTATETGAYTTSIGDSIFYDTVNIVVHPLPVADFSFTPDNICVSTPVQFNNLSSGSGLSYSWNFGDAASGSTNTSTAANPVHRFIGTPGSQPQTFKVKLTVTSSAGCKIADSLNVTVAQSPGTQLTVPAANRVTGSPASFRQCGTSSFTFTFTNASTTLATNTFYRIIWGDGQPDFTAASFASTTHTYAVGTRTLRFIVTGAGGCMDTTDYTVFVGTNPAVSMGNPGNTNICSADSLTFPITGVGSNTDGTRYIITFNDGSRPDTFYHPNIFPSITHTFLTSSCGVNSSDGFTTFNNSYSARIVASNLCGTSSGTVVPIYVSQKPQASFTLSRDTACVNQVVSVSSTNPLNHSVDGSGSCTPGKNIWQIMPASGWTVTSGSMGNDAGSADPDIWTNGSSTVGFNFNTPGIYTIKLTTGNSAQCGITTVTRTICVNAVSDAPFSLNTTSGCGPLAVTATNNSSAPLCGNNTYAWTITYSNTTGCAPALSSWSFTGGTNAASVNPQFLFTNPGVYTIRLTTTRPGGACTAQTTQQVTVKAKPNAGIAAIAAFCQGGSVTPSATINNCYGVTPATYTWTFPGGTPATASTQNPGPVSFPTPGNHTISLDVANECGVTTVTQAITVKPKPDVTVPANKVLCTGTATGAITFTGSMPNTTFNWTNSHTSIGLAATGSGNITSFNAVNNGAAAVVATITVTPVNSNGCSGTGQAFTITVNPKPAAPVVTSPIAYCAGNTATPLTATPAAGNDLLWYTAAAGGTGSTAAPTPSTATAGNTGYYVSQVNPVTGCESARSVINVNVTATPAISGSSATQPAACGASNGAITLTGLTPATAYTVTYTKNSGAPTTINLTANGSGVITINGLGAGNYSGITVSLNGCPSNGAGPFTLADPNPPATPLATANAPVCSGRSLTLNAISATPGVTYSWTGPNGFSSATQNPVIASASLAASGTYTVTATFNGCISPAGTVDVIVNETPAVPTASSNSAICSGNDLTLSALSATAGVTYSWTGPNGFTSSLQNPAITNATIGATGTYSVTATLGGCVSAASNTGVTVKPTPVIGATSVTDPSSCASATGSITLNGLANNIAYTVGYTKNGGAPVTATINSNGSGVLVIPSLSAGTYAQIQVLQNGCPSNIAGPFTLSDPTPPPTPVASTPGPVCSGATLNLQASNIPGATYTWSGPNNFTSNSKDPSIPNVPMAAAGTYSVTATVTGCTSPAGTVAVTINQTPAIPAVSGNGPICTNETLELFANSSTVGVSYSWTGPNGFSSTLKDPSIAMATTAASGVYTVTATLGSCFATGTVTALVKPRPVIASGIATNPATCNATDGSIALTGLSAGTTYSVSYTKNLGTPVLLNLTANASGVVTIGSLGAGGYSDISVTLNGCLSNIAGPFNLSDPTPPAIPAAGSNGPVCSGATLNLMATSATAGVSYSWTGPNGFSSTLKDPSLATVTMAANGTYNVTASLNGCTSAAASVSVVINQTPAMPTAGSNSPVCTGSTLTLTATTGTPGAISYAWAGPNAYSSNLQHPAINNATAADEGAYTVTATLGTCTSQPANLAVIVHATPVIASGAVSHPTNCNTATGSIQLNGLLANTGYAVSYVKNSGAPVTVTVLSDNTGALLITGLSAGTYNPVSVSLNNCPSLPAGPFTLNDPNPPVVPVVASGGPVCTGTALNLTAQSATAGVSYAWTGPNGFASALQNPVIPAVTMAANGIYNVTATLNGCTSPVGTVQVTVNQTPAAPAAGSNSPVCTGNSINLTALSATPGSINYSWSGPNGFTSTQPSPVIANATLAASGMYTVTATLGSCVSTATTLNVVVDPTPNIGGVTTVNPASCNSNTGNISLNGLLPAASYTVRYTKNGGPVTTVTLASDASGVLTIPALGSGVYNNISVVLNGCPSNTVGPFTLTDPAPPAVPVTASNGPLCNGATMQLTASSATPGVTYAWTGPNGFSSNLQNPSITLVTPTASGTYSVTATLNGCTSVAGTVDVVINALPAAPAVTTPVVYCKDVTATPLTANAAPGSTLLWYTAANGGTGNGTAPVPATNNAGTTSYFVSQVFTATGCEGARGQIEVLVHPDAAASFSFPQDTACPPFNILIQNNAPVGRNNSYQWYANNILIGSGTAFPGHVLTAQSSSVTIKQVASSAFGCKPDSIEHIFYTRPSPTPMFTLSTSEGCGPLPVTLTNNTPVIDTFRYRWEFGNGVVSNAKQPGTVVFQPNPNFGDTTYFVKLFAFNECDTVMISSPVTVHSKPKALFTPDKSVGCSPMRVWFNNISKGIGNVYTWDFGDGSPLVSTTLRDSISHMFHAGVRDTFYVKLRVVNDCGSDSLVYAIIVSPNTIALDFAVNGSQQQGCAPHTVNFVNNTQGATSFFWNFGDGNTLSTTQNIDTVTHTYLQSGTYQVTLRATNGCSDTTATETISVFLKPTAAFTINRFTACLGDSLRFTNLSDSATGYLWVFGDGNTSTLTNPVHRYATAGVHVVKLFAFRVNAMGNVCTDSSFISVQVTATQTGNFLLSDTAGSCAPFTITLRNSNLPSVTTTWNVNDGSPNRTGDTIVHTFQRPGTFNITLTATVPGGCTYITSKPVTIGGPEGQLLYNGGYVCAGRAARFEVLATGTDSIVYNFGDGVTLRTTQQVVYHTYAGPGWYLPKVTLRSAGGCALTLKGADTIRVDRTEGGFIASQQRLCGFTTVSFTDTSHVFFGKASVRWYFGDGRDTIAVNPAHNYTTGGTYTVMQIITGTSGCRDTVTRQVQVMVNSKPAVAISGDTVLCTNVPVNFLGNIQSTDAISVIGWKLSNGVTGTGPSLATRFTTAGLYTLQLKVGTINGCFDSATHTIVVNPSPSIIASNDLVLCRGNSAQVAATGTLQYSWTPSQGLSCTNCPNPVASPLVTTPYVVQGTNSFGCSAYDTVVVTVMQPFTMTVSGDEKICIGSSTGLLAGGASRYAWTPRITLSDSSISNPIATPTATTRYRVVGYDGANCFTDTAFVTVAVGQFPTVNLGPDLVLAAGTTRPMTSVVSNGPIRDWTWTPATNLNCSNCPLPTATMKNDIAYVVKVVTEYGCAATDTIQIKTFCQDVQTYIPNAFTPDGDGVNDVFMVRGTGIMQVKTFRVFNRWGEVVFERANIPANDPAYGWNGKVKGVAGPPDVYVYTAEVICEKGTSYTFKGNVSLIK